MFDLIEVGFSGLMSLIWLGEVDELILPFLVGRMTVSPFKSSKFGEDN